jgi:prepilin-type N-terminal cleavage/methylation domain-containing protein
MTQGFPNAMTAMQNEQELVPLGGTTTTRLSERGTVRGNARVGAGFSLVELLVVVAIILVVGAFAIPTLTTTMDGIRLRAATGSATNIAQRCRMQAVKRNVYQRLHFNTVGSSVALFVTDGTDVAVAPVVGDPKLWAQLWLPSEFAIPGVPAGAGAPPKLTSVQMWGTAPAPNENVDPYFNARGLPCLPAGGICTTTTGFVYYYRYRSGGRTRWAANSISPAGRIESWIWNGNAWGN